MKRNPEISKYLLIMISAALVILVLFFKLNDDSMLIKRMMDFGHVFVFGIMALVIHQLIDKKRGQVKNHLTAWALAMIIGLFVEIVQLGMVDRFFELGDLLKDAIGAAAFLAISARYKTLRSAVIARTMSIVLIILAGIPFYIALIEWRHSEKEFPCINSFENLIEISSWIENGSKLNRTRLYAQQGKHTAEVILLPGKYPGVCKEDLVHNWEGYNVFAMDIYLPGKKDFKVTLRINDKAHNNEFTDRFNRTFNLSPGWNYINVNLNEIENSPTGRNLDLSGIDKFCVFASNLTSSKVIYLDNIRLE